MDHPREKRRDITSTRRQLVNSENAGGETRPPTAVQPAQCGAPDMLTCLQIVQGVGIHGYKQKAVSASAHSAFFHENGVLQCHNIEYHSWPTGVPTVFASCTRTSVRFVPLSNQLGAGSWLSLCIIPSALSCRWPGMFCTTPFLGAAQHPVWGSWGPCRTAPLEAAIPL